MHKNLLFATLIQPGKVFEELSKSDTRAAQVIPRYSLLILILPPLFSWIGGSQLGWRLGGSEPVFLDATGYIIFAFFYIAILCIGFFGTVYISKWMSRTYGAKRHPSLHFSLYTVIATPLVAASAAHLYPDVFFNALIIIPALIWSITLLYKGLPVALSITPERGMLMASSIVGWLLVAAVSLLGISSGLWISGAPSFLGV